MVSYAQALDPRMFRNTISAADRNVVTQLLRNAETEMKGYQTEISRLKTLIYSLESKRDALKKNADRYQSLLSPIRRMPPEILLSIFKFACNENELHYQYELPEVVVLSMVCGGWREMAISTPALWSNLEITFTSDKSKNRFLHNWTKIFMKRSSHSPLDITLNFPSYHLSPKGLRPLDTLVRNCGRWRNMSIFLSPPFFPNSSFDPIRAKVPLLQSLEFRDDSEETSTEMMPPLRCLSVAPSLHTLRISPNLLDPDELTIPWNQIRVLSLHNVHSIDAMAFLEKCSSVVELELFHVGQGHPLVGHMVSDTITSLSLVNIIEEEDVDDFLAYTTLPNLTHLRINAVDDDDVESIWRDWDTDALTEFLDRSACNLTVFHLTRAPVDDDQILSVLKLMPALQCLHIEETPDDDDRIITQAFLEGLTVDPGCSSLLYPTTTPLVPDLAELKLGISADLWEDGAAVQEAFLKMLSSRWLPGDSSPTTEVPTVCLQTVEIVVSSKESLQVLEPLNCFKDAGMCLRMRYHHDSDGSDSESGSSDSESDDDD
ncbi:hypothetical protein PM082_020331 [Marasmius tenuissimus]|nr:hypothetical protein PM082_020331 [Marasmius tenuissimus]